MFRQVLRKIGSVRENILKVSKDGAAQIEKCAYKEINCHSSCASFMVSEIKWRMPPEAMRS